MAWIGEMSMDLRTSGINISPWRSLSNHSECASSSLKTLIASYPIDPSDVNILRIWLDRVPILTYTPSPTCSQQLMWDLNASREVLLRSSVPLSSI